MKDPRLTTLINNLLDYSVELKEGEKVYIEWKGNNTQTFVRELIKGIVHRKATPVWIYNDESILRHLLKNCSEEQIQDYGRFHLEWMKKVDVFLSVRGSNNPFDLADIPNEKLDLYRKHFWQPVHAEQRIRHTRWCVLRYPSDSMAQLAETSQESFEDFYFKVCNLDYRRMAQAMDPLVNLMQDTDQVRIVGPETDLAFSIKNIPVIKCAGKLNIPDGEVYTAPVKKSVNGTIKFNVPTLNAGIVYNNIRLTFREGRITEATCNGDNARLNQILDTDEGSRYCGEFALGINPHIQKPMKDALFDEKIYGSIHLAPGQCYENADNGNKSSIHWDLTLIQTPEYGGGEIYFDGQLIRKDGEFVPPGLKNVLSREALSKS